LDLLNLLNLLNLLKFWLLSIFANQPARVHNEKAILTKARLTHFGGIHADTHVGASTVW
jgi:hypothetical protein